MSISTSAMETSQPWPLSLLRCLLVILALSSTSPVQALYFYLDGASASPKCFYEELPKDTLVVGEPTFPSPPFSASLICTQNIKIGHRRYNLETGHYSALQNQGDAFATNPDLAITVTVDEVFDSDHRVVNTKGSHTGKFTFSAADAGEHRICFTPTGASAGGWLSQGQGHGQVKLTLDLAIGETSAIDSADKGKLSEIAQKVKDLNGRLQDIRREQVFQRVSRRFQRG